MQRKDVKLLKCCLSVKDALDAQEVSCLRELRCACDLLIA